MRGEERHDFAGGSRWFFGSGSNKNGTRGPQAAPGGQQTRSNLRRRTSVRGPGSQGNQASKVIGRGGSFRKPQGRRRQALGRSRKSRRVEGIFTGWVVGFLAGRKREIADKRRGLGRRTLPHGIRRSDHAGGHRRLWPQEGDRHPDYREPLATTSHTAAISIANASLFREARGF